MTNVYLVYYLDKYRSQTKRLKGWDYSSKMMYFITICTKNRYPFFGAIRKEICCLSDIGVIARDEWLRTPIIRRNQRIILDEFIIMPNHIHGIIYLGDGIDQRYANPDGGNQFGRQSHNLASVIRGYKAATTSKARRINQRFAWHTEYHETRILTYQALENIRYYIRTNPKRR